MFEQIIATSPRGHCQRSLARSLAGWLVSQKGLFHFEIYNCYPISSIHLNPTYHPCPSNNIIPFPSADRRGLGWLGAGRRSRECSGWVVEHRAAGAQASFGALDRIAFVKSCLHWHPQCYRSGISIYNSGFLMVTLIYKSRFLMDIPTVGMSKNGVVPPCLAIFIVEITIKPWSTHGFWDIVHIFLRKIFQQPQLG